MERMKPLPPDETIPDDQRLDALLRRYASEPLPLAPGNLETRVWREIRARRDSGNQRPNWLVGILSWRREPQMALAGLVAATAIGSA